MRLVDADSLFKMSRAKDEDRRGAQTTDKRRSINEGLTRPKGVSETSRGWRKHQPLSRCYKRTALIVFKFRGETKLVIDCNLSGLAKKSKAPSRLYTTLISFIARAGPTEDGSLESYSLAGQQTKNDD